jgi:hypothetical protein
LESGSDGRTIRISRVDGEPTGIPLDEIRLAVEWIIVTTLIVKYGNFYPDETV